MAKIAVLERKCTGCGLCEKSCPFGAIGLSGGKAHLNEACRACGACAKACPSGAVIRLETRTESVDKSKWRGILVYSEISAGHLHPVSTELIGKALELAAPLGYEVNTVLVGDGAKALSEELRHYGVSKIFVYDAPELAGFRADESLMKALSDWMEKGSAGSDWDMESSFLEATDGGTYGIQ